MRRHPDFQVIGLGRAETHIAGAQRQHAVGQTELLQNRFGMADHFFQRSVAVVRVHDLHHLDLVELVLADQAARVTTGAAGLRPETGAVGGQLDRHLRSVENLLAHTVGQGDFGGRDQVLLLRSLVTAAQNPEHVLFEFW